MSPTERKEDCCLGHLRRAVSGPCGEWAQQQSKDMKYSGGIPRAQQIWRHRDCKAPYGVSSCSLMLMYRRILSPLGLVEWVGFLDAGQVCE